MKTRIATLLILSLVVLAATADPATTAKQRAKELNQQNNVRQGIAAPAPQTTAPPPAARPAQADPVARLKADLVTLAAQTSATAAQKDQLAKDLMAAARGSRKPSADTVGKLAGHLGDALVGQPLDGPTQTRLAQNLNLAMNSAGLSDARTGEIAADVQAILQVGGAARPAALTATGSLRAVMAELHASP